MGFVAITRKSSILDCRGSPSAPKSELLSSMPPVALTAGTRTKARFVSCNRRRTFNNFRLKSESIRYP